MTTEPPVGHVHGRMESSTPPAATAPRPMPTPPDAPGAEENDGELIDLHMCTDANLVEMFTEQEYDSPEARGIAREINRRLATLRAALAAREQENARARAARRASEEERCHAVCDVQQWMDQMDAHSHATRDALARGDKLTADREMAGHDEVERKILQTVAWLVEHRYEDLAELRAEAALLQEENALLWRDRDRAFGEVEQLQSAAQTARQETIERCAKLADNWRVSVFHEASHDKTEITLEPLAAEIRALAAEPSLSPPTPGGAG